MEPDHLAKRYRRSLSEGTERSKRRRREAPYTIYPEILVIVDYDGYRLHGGDNQQIKRYFVSFWNGVDMRYKLLKGPKVRISIAGIIISRVSKWFLFNAKSVHIQNLHPHQFQCQSPLKAPSHFSGSFP